MKKISDIKGTITRVTIFAAMIMVTLILPGIGYAQPAPGGNPDGNPPVGVPFDRSMSIGLIVAGIILALVVFRKLKNKTSVKSI
jgi:hypothetical protein